MAPKALIGKGKDKEEQDAESDKGDMIETIQVQFKARSKDKFKTCASKKNRAIKL